jgi:hypothetical protein
LDDTNRIESSKLAFFDAMEKTDHVLKPEKVQRLTGLMDKAMKGIRRIAALFNRRNENKKSSVRVGKSWVHQIPKNELIMECKPNEIIKLNIGSVYDYVYG